MAIQVPDFDFGAYDPKDAWHFPAQRLVHFAASSYALIAGKRHFWIQRHAHPDFRFVVWHELGSHAHALLLGAQHLRSHGEDAQWWESQPEFDHAFKRPLIANNNANLRKMLQLGFAQGTIRTSDMLLRQIHSALVPETPAPAMPLTKVWAKVLEMADRPEYTALPRLWLIFRDQINQNGRFCPLDGRETHVRYRGRAFGFHPGMEIDFQQLGFIDDWDFLRYLLLELVSLLEEVLQSATVQSIRFLKVPYLDA